MALPGAAPAPAQSSLQFVCECDSLDLPQGAVPMLWHDISVISPKSGNRQTRFNSSPQEGAAIKDLERRLQNPIQMPFPAFIDRSHKLCKV